MNIEKILTKLLVCNNLDINVRVIGDDKHIKTPTALFYCRWSPSILVVNTNMLTDENNIAFEISKKLCYLKGVDINKSVDFLQKAGYNLNK